MQGEFGAVGGGDGVDDRQSESEAVVCSGDPVGVCALEWLEQAGDLLGGEAGSGVWSP
jgi:hypothetical protein